jgi:transcriptional regulator with XRE-family HTH domain
MTQSGLATFRPESGDEELVTKATLKAANFLGINRATLVRVLGVSPSQISKLEKGRAVLSAKSFETGLLLVRLYRSLAGIVGQDEEAMRSWMNGFNTQLRGKPMDLIQGITGLVDTINYLDSRRARI